MQEAGITNPEKRLTQWILGVLFALLMCCIGFILNQVITAQHIQDARIEAHEDRIRTMEVTMSAFRASQEEAIRRLASIENKLDKLK